MSSLVVAFVTDGVSATALTAIVAVARPPPNPPLVAFNDACTWKLPFAKEFARRSEFHPGVAFSKGDEVAVVDHTRPIVLKECATSDARDLEVTSAPSTAFRLTTRPVVVCVSSLVVALVTDGVSATALTVIVAVARPPPNPPAVALSDACAWKLPFAKEFVEGVNSAGVTFSKGNEVAVVDRTRPIVLKECATSDARDLEVRDLSPVSRVTSDNETRRCLCILVGRCIRYGRRICHGD